MDEDRGTALPGNVVRIDEEREQMGLEAVPGWLRERL